MRSWFNQTFIHAVLANLRRTEGDTTSAFPNEHRYAAPGMAAADETEAVP